MEDILFQQSNLSNEAKQKVYFLANLVVAEDLIGRKLFKEAEKLLFILHKIEAKVDLDIHEKLAGVVFMLVNCLLSKKEYDRALAILSSFKNTFKHSAKYFALIGKIFEGQGDLKQAVSVLKEGCYSHPKDVELHCTLFDYFELQRESLQAVDVLKRLTNASNSPFTYRVALQKIKTQHNRNMTNNKIKIALLSNFTFDQIETYLDLECRLINLMPKFYNAGYDVYNQEMLDSHSGLYNFKPDLVLLAIHTRQLFPELYYELSEVNTQKLWKTVVQKFDNLEKSVSCYLNNSKSIVLINRFTIPTYTPLSIHDFMEKNSQERIVNYLNRRLLKLGKKWFSRIKIVDLERTLSRVGKEFATDETKRILAKMEIAERAMPFIAREYMRFIKPLKSKNKKCIVLDLDNTLWGGIIGEDGIENIKLGIEPPGNAYLEFQRLLKCFYDKGIILVVNSKNNYEDAMEMFQKHPDMVLKKEHFACLKINWENKVKNMFDIATEINLNLDSFIFIDDNPAERKLIRDFLPEVFVLELPKDPSGFSKALNQLTDLDTLFLTKEDKIRGQMYLGEIKRNQLKKNSVTIKEYLTSLKMIVDIFHVDKFSLPRITQLINKTNQFNLTTRRYSEEEVRAFAEASSSDVYGLKVKDIFGDSGIVGVTVLRKYNSRWTIDSFLMSCRVLGRKLEESFLDHIICKAMKNNVLEVYGEYIPTRKNAQTKSFYCNAGFSPAGTKDGIELYNLRIADYTPKKFDFIKYN